MGRAVSVSALWLALKRAKVAKKTIVYDESQASFARCVAKKCTSGAEALGPLSDLRHD
jgi:hypothetical protein